MVAQQHRRSRPHSGPLRNEQARRDILDAAIELAEEGLEHVTVDRIAARCGVGKQTVYRWWPSKWEVVLEALLDRAEQVAPDRGADGEVERFLQSAFDAITRSGGSAALLRALMAHAQLDPQFAELWRDRFIQPRRAALSRLLTEAERSGDLRADVDPEVATDMLFGAMWYRLLVGHGTLDAGYAARLARTVTTARPPNLPPT